MNTPEDNPKNERFNRTIKEEFLNVDEYFESYLIEKDLTEANERLTEWLIFYNFKRPHQALKYQTLIEFTYNIQKVSAMSPASTLH